MRPLARYTAARLGGRADYLYIAKDPDYSDVCELLAIAWARTRRSLSLAAARIS